MQKIGTCLVRTFLFQVWDSLMHTNYGFISQKYFLPSVTLILASRVFFIGNYIVIYLKFPQGSVYGRNETLSYNTLFVERFVYPEAETFLIDTNINFLEEAISVQTVCLSPNCKNIMSDATIQEIPKLVYNVLASGTQCIWFHLNTKALGLVHRQFARIYCCFWS